MDFSGALMHISARRFVLGGVLGGVLVLRGLSSVSNNLRWTFLMHNGDVDMVAVGFWDEG